MLSAALFLGSGAVFARTLKRSFLAAWRGSLAVTAEVLIGICWALGLGQLLGAAGWLRTGPLVAAAVASAGAAAYVLRPGGAGSGLADDEGAGGESAAGESAAGEGAAGEGAAGEPAAAVSPPTWRADPALLVTTVLLVLLVAAIWSARTVLAVRRGINDPDSLGYHLPFAATFAQTGYADQNRYLFPALPIQFYPANDELLSALALVLTKSVAFAAVKNLLFGGLTLVAAHAMGKAFGVGLLAVSGAALALGLPVIAFSQPGEAVNDALVVLVVLGGLAVVAHGRDQAAPYVLALACAGAVCGTKLSALVPGVALGGLALWLLLVRMPARRWWAAGGGLLAGGAAGGSWYLRNTLSYGSPLPPARIGLGPFHLRQIQTDALHDSYSVAWYLLRGRALGQLVDGLGEGLGPLFVVALAGVVVGAVAGLRSRDGFRRGCGVLVIVTGIGYLTTPASAYGPEGNPAGFVINLHYAAAVVAVGLVAAALAIGRRRWAFLLPAVGWAAVVTGIPAGRRIPFWAPEIGGRGFAVLVAASIAGGAVAWLWVRPPLVRWAPVASASTAVVALLAVAVIYRQQPRLAETDPLQRWAQREAPTRIAGWVPEMALLYGPGVPNRATIFTRLVDGAPVALDSCPAWMQALGDGRYPFAGVIPATPWQRWVEADPAFQLVAQREGHAAIYRVTGPPDVRCPGAR